MSFFTTILRRSGDYQSLVSRPDPDFNKAIMNEEEDALNWKISREMIDSWLGLEIESTK